MRVLIGEDVLALVLADVIVSKFVHTSRLEFFEATISPTCDYIINVFSCVM